MSATNRGAIRVKADFYPTPLKSFDPLIPYIQTDTVWEPAKGDGRLVSRMIQYGIRANGDDLNNGYDFLKDSRFHKCIITNPPFSHALEFCQHAIDHAYQVFMLLRLNFLASKRRRDWWIKHEPSALFVLSERPSFTGHGTDATDYAWFYWGDLYKGVIHL